LIPEWGPGVLLIGLLGKGTPNAIGDLTYVTDGQIIENDFLVLESLGHTNGHLCFFHTPTETLFAGDALAIIENEIRYMARFVTPDLKAAKKSMMRILEMPAKVICPGHRSPVTDNVVQKCKVKLAKMKQGEPWPLFG
jgi:glyoxylase-like metal-dependent hydrolase (beta-lactamase superfamily II)